LRKASRTTVPIRVPKRRADEDPELLFYRLEQFANLPNTIEAHADFGSRYPDFLPVTFYDRELGEKSRECPVGWQSEFYEVFKIFQDLLRDVWKHGDPSQLAILMGIADWKAEPRFIDDVLQGHRSRLKKARARIPEKYFAIEAAVTPDWRLGSFRYDAETDFRKAMYALFRQSWRAKVCPKCEKYFVAAKPARFYCSTECYGLAKSDRDIEYWRTSGSSRRRDRKAKEKKQ
jgi:hypothetical protein